MSLDVVGERRGAEREDHVVVGQLFNDALAHRVQEAGEQAVIFREAAAARHRRHIHAGVVALGQ